MAGLVNAVKEAGSYQLRLDQKLMSKNGTASNSFYLVYKAGDLVKVEPLVLLK